MDHVGETAGSGYRRGDDDIFRTAVVVGEVYTQTTFQEFELTTDLEGAGRFRTQEGVTQYGRALECIHTESGEDDVGDETIAIGRCLVEVIAGSVDESVTTVITHLTVAQAQLAVGQNVVVTHSEGFGEGPTEAGRVTEEGVIILWQDRRPVITSGQVQEYGVLVVQIDGSQCTDQLFGEWRL